MRSQATLTTENTTKAAGSCHHCECGHGASPWMKPEVVFLCALGTFGISAVMWAVMTPHGKPASSPVHAAVVAPVQTQAPVSEMDKLFAQARAIPVGPRQKSVAIAVPPNTVARAQSVAVKPPASKPLETKPVEAKPVEAKPVEAKAEEVKSKKVEIAAKPPAEAPNKSVDDVAEYNRALAAFFEKKKTALKIDTADGAAEQTPNEPPSYEEWLKSGKPGF